MKVEKQLLNERIATQKFALSGFGGSFGQRNRVAVAPGATTTRQSAQHLRVL
jgi:hypothetical protein